MQRIASTIATVVVLTAISSSAREIDYIEDFALATDRAKALEQLIPGTQEYYYYHCLHYQNTEQFDKVEQMLQAWIKRHNYSDRVREIQNRQALLTYTQHPRESLEFIRKQLGIHFDHQREALDEKPQLPSALDARLIAPAALTDAALKRYENLEGFEDSALDWLVARELDAKRLRHLLSRLQRPDVANLPQLVVEDLNQRDSRGFGQFAIHRQLLQSQLEQCLRLKPELLNNANFVNTYLSKLHPNSDIDWRHDPKQHEQYLERLWSFVRRLAPVHNSLKAHVLYHQLALDRSRDLNDKGRFMEYIQLPRNVGYISRDFLARGDNRQYAANLGQDFRSVTLLPPVGDDEPLVRSYLHHFFVNETTFEPYAPYLNDTFLKHNFAEAKIINGLGEPEQWYSMLPPANYQRLKDRVDLDFAHTNKKLFAADEPVSLDLHVKNVRTLTVKVFEINTRNYYRQNAQEVNTDIDLDGLVANQEIAHNYDDPPLRRVKRHFEFPSLGKPGVYVIDFIGNGKSSRAVVRKGKLRHLVRTSTAGQVFTVLDEKNQKVPDATLWLAGHEYTPDENGTITVPFSSQPGRQPVVLSRGDFSSLQFFEHQSENYNLTAGIYVDRESLLVRRKAKLVVRPGLYLNGTPVTLSVLKNVRLVLRSVDHDGVATTMEISEFLLHEDRESVHEFQVPPRLSQISVTLTAKVRNLSQNKEIDLSVAETFSLNEIDRTERVEDLHFAKVNGVYAVDVLGKTGEPRPDRPVRFSIKLRDYRDKVEVTLQTGEHGRIHLGPLEGVASVTATGPNETTHTWQVVSDRHTYPNALHGRAGETVQVPYMGTLEEPARSELSLLELRGETFVADRFEALTIQDGLLCLEDLPAGDYDLLLKGSGERVRIRLAEGERREDYVLGSHRQLEARGDSPLQIGRIESSDEHLRIQLRNATPFARVHVFATRYHPAFSAFESLSRVRDANPYHIPVAKLESLFVEGRDIGDEYRYIIDRKQAQKFPGNMLERPSLLLNPWAVRKTETGEQQAVEGDEYGAVSEEKAPPAAQPKAETSAPTGLGDSANLDFLYDASAVLLNLTPDENGVVSINRNDLGPHQDVCVVAIDPRSTAYRRVSLPEQDRKVLDLTLAAGLDAKQHYTQQKRISILRKGETLGVADVASSRVEAYDSLARFYRLFVTLSGDPKLVQFSFILNWPDMTEEQKRDKYSEFACHELNFFIFKKDPEFFERVVRPYVDNKRDKTFLDRWLVQDDLRESLQPWSHAQLNIVEQILLGQRIDGERPYTARHVQDLFDLIPLDVDRFNLLFDTAVRGSALETDGAIDDWAEIGGAGTVREFSTNLSLEVAQTQQVHEDVERSKAASARPALELESPAEESEVLAESMDRELDALADKDTADRKRGAARRRSGGRAYYGRDARRRELARRLYEKLDKTQEWVENNYYQLPIEQQNTDLVAVNAFWNDYAQHEGGQPFFSTRWPEASHNFTEMMFALSMLDIPFKAAEHTTKLEGSSMTLTAASPMIVFHEEIRQTKDAASETPILVSQNFFRQDDRYQHVNNERVDKFVTDEFLVHTVYGCQVVVTNPTSSPQKLDVLLQIPVGALPVNSGRYTRSVHVDLKPYNTQTIEYYFYFPEAGQFAHYPVHVSKNEQLVANAEPFTFFVVARPTQIDRQSWQYVSQYGSDHQVIQFLRENNVRRIDLAKIAFRMSNKDFFRQVTELLAERHAYDDTLWSYGIKHNIVAAIRQYLQHADQFVGQCGDYVDSPLLVVDPVVRKTYQHMDYRPLVNARAHQLGSRRQILNDRFHEQYHDLLRVLSYRRDLDDDDLMSVTYYMLLQDRIEAALQFFGRVNADRLATRLQHDYFTAYTDFYLGDVVRARTITDKYADYPVDRWRKAFASVASQLDEVEGKAHDVVDAEDRAQNQTGLAASAPNFDLRVEAKKVRIDFQNVETVRVNYYLMDLELLFSRNPFVQHFAGQFSHIRPNQSEVVELPSRQNVVEIDLPQALHNRNVLVEVVGGGQSKTQAYYSNSITVQVIENYGQLRVTHSQTRKPLAKVYVKAYAQMEDGTVRFYKDGYTDLRGRFDYTSLNTNELDYVRRFSLLVHSDECGAVVREANPPKR